MNEDRFREDMERASAANALLENKLLNEAFDYLTNNYTEAWKVCQDQAMREASWYLVTSLGLVKRHLQKVISDGMLAQRDLDNLIKAQKRNRAA